MQEWNYGCMARPLCFSQSPYGNGADVPASLGQASHSSIRSFYTLFGMLAAVAALENVSERTESKAVSKCDCDLLTDCVERE